MPRYSQFKYGKAKYGRYDLVISSSIPLQSIQRYRLRTIDKDMNESRPITHISCEIKGVNGPANVRVKAIDGSWVYSESSAVPGNPLKVRVSSVSGGVRSSWVESVTGTINK